MALSICTWGAGLNLDGIMMIRGMSMAGARVIIITGQGTPRVLTRDLDHFSLRLDLGTEYLLSFERPGCVSKQLRFNTSVPSGYPVEDGFYFPFQVTLEPLPEGQRFTYAGPVGSIHFDKYINAFGYDTDYRIAKDEVLSKRLDLARTELERDAARDPGPEVVPSSGSSASLVTKTPVPSGSPYELIAPTVSRTAPLVHVLETPVERMDALPSDEKPLYVAQDEIRPIGPGPELLAQGPAPGKQGLQASAAMPFQRWKDVRADRLHVITTIMVQEEEREVEYRRVVSYYGGITYFRDGMPCSEMIYQKGIDH